MKGLFTPISTQSHNFLAAFSMIAVIGYAPNFSEAAGPTPQGRLEVWGPLDLELVGDSPSSHTSLMDQAKRFCAARSRHPVVEGIDPSAGVAHVHCYRTVSFVYSLLGDSGRD